MNHQDFPILVAIVNKLLTDGEVDLNEGIFPDIFNDYAARLHETPETTRIRFKSIIKYLSTSIAKLHDSYHTIAFSIDYLNAVESVLASCLIKLRTPSTQIVWGGPTITQSYDAYKIFLTKNICDGLVIGEGEYPFLKIAQGTDLSHIEGVMSFNNNDFRYIPGIQLDINSLPTPDYTNLPLDTYYEIASLYRSRGCTHRCKFCAEWKLFGPRFRVRSIDNVINDIDTIIEKHHPKYMIFGESLINDDLDYFDFLCEEMIENNFNINFGTHFRANITPELAEKAYKAGFNDAWVGFEAFSEQDLKEMNKGTSVNQNITTIRNLTQADINVIAMLVIGFSNIEEEIRNCDIIIQLIEQFSKETYKNRLGHNVPLSIQWRPAPMYIVPGSLDYNEKKGNKTYPWLYHKVPDAGLLALQKELSEIPYEFERPLPDEKVGDLMRKIQNADRNAGFAVGGIAKYVIKYLVELRRNQRILRKAERIGIIAQRFNKELSNYNVE